MDAALVQNWNDTVTPEDTVYFLGDLTLRGRRFHDMLALLNGNKVLVQGNHDPDLPDIPRVIIREIDGIPILFVHNPADIPEGYEGWVIHGHQHNNTPLFSQELKRVNVSVENTEYRPVMLQGIIELIKTE